VNGGFIALKPPGMTSHDVVAFVRRLTGVRRVGHSGTLDPGAGGVLPICVGPAVRLVEYLQEGRKVYRFQLILGETTDTQDASGRVRERRPVTTGRGDLEEVLPRFVGLIEQVPPMFSSLKKGGHPLHELARRGIEVDRPTRLVTIHDLRLLDYRAGAGSARAVLEVTCSKGTYVRTLCADIGESLGVGGHMGFLVRLETGGFRTEEAVTLEELAEAERQGELEGLLWRAVDLLRGWPEVIVGRPEELAVTTGRRRDVAGLWREPAGRSADGDRGRVTGQEQGRLVKVTCEGRLVAVGRLAARPGEGRAMVHVEKAFPRGSEG